jgi:hypothetical protein
MGGLPQSGLLRIGKAASDQPAEVDHHLAPLCHRQFRPSHSFRPRVHGHGAAPANEPRSAGPHGPLLDMDSTGLTFQRFRGWSVERLFAWLSRYRRLNTVFDRKADLFVAHVWIAISSILARRLLRSQGIDLQHV